MGARPSASADAHGLPRAATHVPRPPSTLGGFVRLGVVGTQRLHAERGDAGVAALGGAPGGLCPPRAQSHAHRPPSSPEGQCRPLKGDAWVLPFPLSAGVVFGPQMTGLQTVITLS